MQDLLERGIVKGSSEAGWTLTPFGEDIADEVLERWDDAMEEQQDPERPPAKKRRSGNEDEKAEIDGKAEKQDHNTATPEAKSQAARGEFEYEDLTGDDVVAAVLAESAREVDVAAFKNSGAGSKDPGAGSGGSSSKG